MKNHININNLKNTIHAVGCKLNAKRTMLREKLKEEDGQFVMDHAVVFVLIIVLAGIALALLTTWLQSDLAPALTGRINDFFS